MKSRSRRSRRRLSPPAVALVASLTIATVELVGEKLMEELNAITAIQVHARERALSAPAAAQPHASGWEETDLDTPMPPPLRPQSVPASQSGLPFRDWSETLPSADTPAAQRHSHWSREAAMRVAAARFWQQVLAELDLSESYAMAIPEPGTVALGSLGLMLGWLSSRWRRA